MSNYQPVTANFDSNGNLLQFWGPNGKVALDPSNVAFTGGVIGPTKLVPSSGDTSGATDTANLLAAMTSYPIVLLSAADYYVLPNQLVVPNRVKIVGCGSSDGYGIVATPSYGTGGDTAATRIICNTTTGNILELQGPGSVVEDVHFSNSAATNSTAGAAVKLNGCHGSAINRCSTFRSFYSIDVANCTGYTITNNKFYAPINSGVRINNSSNSDEGDPVIIGNQFVAGVIPAMANPLCAVLFQSGGGVKFVGNKINREYPTLASGYYFSYGVVIQPKSGVFTSDFIVNANSIENTISHGVYLDGSQGGTGSFSNVHVTDTQFLGANVAGSCCVYVAGTSTYPFKNIVIDNIVSQSHRSYVNLTQYCSGVYVGKVSANSFPEGVILIGSAGGVAQASATVTSVSYDLSRINLTNAVNPILLQDYTVNATDGHTKGATPGRLIRQIPSFGATPYVANVFKLYLSQYQAARVKVILNGNFAGFGAATMIAERSLTCSAAGTITATAIGTDYNNAAATCGVVIGFNVSTGNLCVITLTTSAVGITSNAPGCGTMTLELDGNFYQIESDFF